MAIQVLNDMESGEQPGRGQVLPDERSFRNAIIACNQAEHALRRQEQLQRDGRHRKASKHKDCSNLSNGLFEWWECALSLLRRMQENGLSPDIQTLSSAISACEAAGQWQRALGVLQSILDDSENAQKDPDDGLNLYCFNAAMSACQKGGAWVECLEIYEKLKSHGGALSPNSVSLSSLVLACEEAGQKELAVDKYREGLKCGIIPSPWRTTTMMAASAATPRNATNQRRVAVPVRAMDLHHYSAAMAKAAARSYLDSLLASRSSPVIGDTGWMIIVGRGLRSRDNEPVLFPTLRRLLEEEYGIEVKKAKPGDGEYNAGRIVVTADTLRQFVASKSWRV
jgi:tetratricopeptide (TPR) repeat protein